MCQAGSISAALPNSDRASAWSAIAAILVPLIVLLPVKHSWRPRQRKFNKRVIAGCPRSQFRALHSVEPKIVCARVALGPRAPSTRLGSDFTQLLYSPKLEKSRCNNVVNAHTHVRSLDCSAVPKCARSTAASTPSASGCEGPLNSSRVTLTMPHDVPPK